MNEHSLVIDETTPNLDLFHEHDQYLMSLFVSMGYSGGDLKALNRCRLYLQVHALSEILTGCGKRITWKAFQGRYEPEIPKTVRWPIQSNPVRADWRLWQSALTRLCSRPYNLYRPVGRWIGQDHKMYWYLDFASDRLYRQMSTGERVYHLPWSGRRGRATGRRFNLQSHSTGDVDLHLMQKGLAYISNQAIIYTGGADTIFEERLGPSSFLESLSHAGALPNWIKDHIRLGSSPSQIQALLLVGPVCAVSDSSYFEGLGTASWIWFHHLGTVLLEGSVIVPGRIEDQSPLRSETAGIYAVALTIHALCSLWGLVQGQIEVVVMRRLC